MSRHDNFKQIGAESEKTEEAIQSILESSDYAKKMYMINTYRNQ